MNGQLTGKGRLRVLILLFNSRPHPLSDFGESFFLIFPKRNGSQFLGCIFGKHFIVEKFLQLRIEAKRSVVERLQQDGDQSDITGQ